VQFLAQVTDVHIHHVAAGAAVVFVHVIPNVRSCHQLALAPGEVLEQRVLSRREFE
jgi:hypothetical protein